MLVANAKCVSFSPLSQISLCRLRVQFKSKQLHCERYLPAEFPSRLVHLLVQFMYGYRIMKTHHTCIGTHTSSKSPHVYATSSTYSNSPIAYHIDSTILTRSAGKEIDASKEMVLGPVSAPRVSVKLFIHIPIFSSLVFSSTQFFFFSRVAHIFACTGGVLAAHIRALRRLQTRHFSCCWKFMFIFSLHIIDILYVNHILLHFSSFVAFTCLRHLRATLSPSRKCKFEQKMGCMSYLFWVCLRRYTYKVREANRIFFFSLEFSRHVLQAKRFRVTTMCVGIMCAAWCTRNQG